MTSAPILSVRDLRIAYRTGKRSELTAARDISFDLHSGQSMALVGESGCGKTTLGLGLLRLLPRLGYAPRGSVVYQRKDGQSADILTMDAEQLRRFRWNEAAMVFQGAMNAFNPVQRVGQHFADTLIDHRAPARRRPRSGDITARAAELLRMVRLDPDRVLPAFPHELSGGMKQRALIALALALEPRLLVLDEPTTALDLLTQRSIVEQLHELRERLGFAMIFITHDLGLAAELADQVATMYAGRIVENGPVDDIFYRPRHPYTMGLIKSVLPVTGDLPRLESIAGSPPHLAQLPPGCSFAPRCAYVEDACIAAEPPLEQARHASACRRSSELEFRREMISHA